jgi:hypothetical protein
MKAMKVARGTACASRRTGGGGLLMKPPSAAAQAAQLADLKLANRKRATKLYHKAGAGISQASSAQQHPSPGTTGHWQCKTGNRGPDKKTANKK